MIRALPVRPLIKIPILRLAQCAGDHKKSHCYWECDQSHSQIDPSDRYSPHETPKTQPGCPNFGGSLEGIAAAHTWRSLFMPARDDWKRCPLLAHSRHAALAHSRHAARSYERRPRGKADVTVDGMSPIGVARVPAAPSLKRRLRSQLGREDEFGSSYRPANTWLASRSCCSGCPTGSLSRACQRYSRRSTS
jgi:hypothetical protein